MDWRRIKLKALTGEALLSWLGQIVEESTLLAADFAISDIVSGLLDIMS